MNKAVSVYRDFTGPTEQQTLAEKLEAEEPEIGVYRPFTGSQSAPDVSVTLVRSVENLAFKDKQKTDLEISAVDSVHEQKIVPNLQENILKTKPEKA